MLLIDRKMPKSCVDCVCNNDDYRCNMTGDELDYDIAWTGRMPNCPLKEDERKTGKWIDQKGGGCYCSECGKYALDESDGNFIHVSVKSNFCPNCGASMMEGE